MNSTIQDKFGASRIYRLAIAFTNLHLLLQQYRRTTLLYFCVKKSARTQKVTLTFSTKSQLNSIT